MTLSRSFQIVARRRNALGANQGSLSLVYSSVYAATTKQRFATKIRYNSTRREESTRTTIVTKWGDSKKYWMAPEEYAGIVVGKEVTGGEYVISDGIIAPGGFVPDHYHKWEDQTFHVIAGNLEAKIGQTNYSIGPGDSIHCPRMVSHFIKNVGEEEAKLISYIFPGYWAEDFMAETSRQNNEGKPDLNLIEEKFGVVYV